LKRIIWLASGVIVIVLLVIAVGLSLGNSPSSSSTLSTSTFISSHTTSTTVPSISSTASSSFNFIAIDSMSLCSSNCNYPSPYLSGTVFVNSTVPLRSLQLYINGTSEGTSNYTNTLGIAPQLKPIINLDWFSLNWDSSKGKALSMYYASEILRKAGLLPEVYLNFYMTLEIF